jgi:sulfur relay (sulfurtransferase) DsrC/TusE family protein
MKTGNIFIGATKVFAKSLGQKIVAEYYYGINLGFPKKMLLENIYKKYGRSEAKENYINKLIDQNKDIYEKNKNKAYIPDSVYKA